MEPRFFKRGNAEHGGERAHDIVASMEPRFFKRGNSLTDEELRLLKTASMEPRFFKRGNAEKILEAVFKALGFNGATFFQTWKFAGSRDDLESRKGRFNGATFFQTWKWA